MKIVMMHKKLLSRFKRDQQGGVFIFVALALFVLIASVGVAIDMGRVMIARSRAMSALDAGVLGAAAMADANAKPEDIEAMAQQYFDANYPTSFLGSVDTKVTTTVNTANGTVGGHLDIKLPTYFGNFVKLDEVKLGLNSEVTRVAGSKNLEIALALDVTPSMCFDNAGDYSKAACTASKGKLQALRDSVKVLVDSVESAISASGKSSGEAYYSFVPFIHTVKLNGAVNNDFWTEIAGTEYFLPLGYLPTLRGLHRDGSQIVTDLDGVIANMQNAGGTNTAIGTYWGWLSLRKSSVGRFVGTSAHEDTTKHPVEINNPDNFKILVILTDGSNTYMEFDPWHGGKWHENHDILADKDQTALCGQIQKEGIEIYAIAFDVPHDTDGDKIRKIFRDDCAQESTNSGHYFEPETADELKGVFKSIADALIDLRISK